eukprot:403368451
MDMQNRAGSKSSAVASQSEQNLQHKERLRRLHVETADVSNDPYIMRNHLGSFECRLCLTLHTNEASYLAHTTGKKHQTNLHRRQLRENKDNNNLPQPKIKLQKKNTIKIGRPGYRVIKQKDPDNGQKSLLFEVEYPEIESKLQPRYRIMSAYEQKVETPDDKYQYLLFAADPYETIAFKIPNLEIDFSEGKYFDAWDKDQRKYTLQIFFKEKKVARVKAA